jgi:hypothetical protein
LFLPYLPPGEELSAVKRTLLSGSFLDEKSGGVYFFSHRSFQEFLVAEYIWSLISEAATISPEDSSLIASVLTQEVFDFLIEKNDAAFFRALLSTFGRLQAALPKSLLIVLSSSETIRKICAGRSSSFFSILDAAILIAHACSASTDLKANLSRATGVIIEKASSKPAVLLSAASLLIAFSCMKGITVKRYAPMAVRILFSRAETDLRLLAVEQARHTRGDLLRDAIFGAVSAQWSSEKRRLVLDLDIFELLSASESTPGFPISLDDTAVVPNYMAPFPTFFAEVPERLHPVLKKFYENDANISMVSDD